jgi:hypothetical protein
MTHTEFTPSKKMLATLAHLPESRRERAIASWRSIQERRVVADVDRSLVVDGVWTGSVYCHLWNSVH